MTVIWYTEHQPCGVEELVVPRGGNIFSRMRSEHVYKLDANSWTFRSDGFGRLSIR